MWYIQENVNNGYPAQNSWITEWQTGWTSNRQHRYPDKMWRIKAGTNNGYPWKYWWFPDQEQYDEGEMVIGGSQTNYPNGFSYADRGGIRDDFDDHSMISTGNGGGSYANAVMTLALNNRAFVITGGKLQDCLAALNDTTVFDQVAIETISKMYGANVFDSFISCKIFPFDLQRISFWGAYGVQSVISSTTGTIKAFGRYDLATGANLLGSSYGFYKFPTIHVEPLQAWEIESIDFSLYLPFSGVYPIDLRGESDIDIMLYVDLISGAGEYYVHINAQLVAIHRVMFGADVPINTNQGRMQENFLANVTSSVTKGAQLAAGIAGGLIGGGVGATIGAGIVNGLAGSFPTEHYAMSTPAIGSLASAQCYGYPRVIAKIPKMFNSGYGFKETLGFNRSTTYVHLSECSGFIKCKNYKTDIIVATDEEKQEIEQLMNGGVFV